MSHEIHKVRVRTKLAPQREPYWGPAVAGDLTIGYRKIDAMRGTWIARRRNDDGLPGKKNPQGSPPRFLYESFGLVTETNNYEAAREAALKWRKSRDAGITDEAVTVADACREYVKDRRQEKGEQTAHDAEMRFTRTVYDTPFGALALAKLRTPRLKEWRDGLSLGKASANRTLTTLKAALNLAVTNRRVHPAIQREWADIKPHKDANKRRDLFLDLKQRRALLEAATGAVRDLMEGVALTGARAGELVNATRGQFEPRTGTMVFVGKTGRRSVPLSPSALALFKRLAKDKLPAARLFVRDDGKPWAHSDWDELVRAAADAAEVKIPGKPAAKLPKGVCLYTLRHSFITQAITDGMTTLDVARFAGTSVMMIEKHYGHLAEDAARERLASVRML